MRKTVFVSMILILLLFPMWQGFSQDEETFEHTWNRFGVRMGGFLTLLNSGVRFGVTEATGLQIDIEDALGLDRSLVVFRTDAYWRFSKNRRHRLDAGYAGYFRSASRVLEEDIPIGEDVIEAGTLVDSDYNIQLIKLLYSWSFVQDNRVDLGIGGGFYVMPLTLRIDAETDEVKLQDITAPLPVFDFRMDFLVTPQTYFRFRLDFFYITIDNFTGSIADYELDYEWRFSKYVGVGVGYESFNMRIEGSGDGTGLWQPSGTISTQYNGIIFYGKFYF